LSTFGIFALLCKGTRDKEQGHKGNFEFLILNFELKTKDQGYKQRIREQGKR
jgi:hypothetical protein